METMTQIIAQDTEADPEGGPGGRRIKNTSRLTAHLDRG